MGDASQHEGLILLVDRLQGDPRPQQANGRRKRMWLTKSTRVFRARADCAAKSLSADSTSSVQERPTAPTCDFRSLAPLYASSPAALSAARMLAISASRADSGCGAELCCKCAAYPSAVSSFWGQVRDHGPAGRCGGGETHRVRGEHRIGESVVPQGLGERIARGGVQHLPWRRGGWVRRTETQPRTRLGGLRNRSPTYLVAHFGCVGHVADGEPLGCGRIESNEIIRRDISRDQPGQLLQVALETSRSLGHTVWHERLCDGLSYAWRTPRRHGQHCNEPFLIETLMILTSTLSTALANVSSSSCEAPIPDAEFMLWFKVTRCIRGGLQMYDDENKGLHCITRVSTKGEKHL